jgi:uncharacterized protein YfaS (alpha-2-macroglobulin family)
LRLLFVLLLVVFGLVSAHGARAADNFYPPGLAADSAAYARSLTQRSPAGGTVQARAAAETRAAEAASRGDWAAAAAALEQRLSLGQSTPDLWHLLAQAQLHRAPPDYTHALAAAWQEFSATDDGAPQIPALLLMADALRALSRPVQAVDALQAVVGFAPENAQYRQQLADLLHAVGMLVQRVTTQPEADPPRACITFTIPPSRRDDFHPQDWVRLDPPLPDAAVTRESDQLCVSGLPSGQTTRIILRAGLPAEQSLALAHEAPILVAMANRLPRIIIDTRRFVLPRTQVAKLGITTVNLSSVKLTLARITERNLVDYAQDNTIGQPVSGYGANSITETFGAPVWQGSADIPEWQPNRLVHTALPLPEALQTAGPGLYALILTPGDGTPASPQRTTAVAVVMRTDLAPTIWRGSDGLTIQLRSYADAKPIPAAELHLMARNNDILATTQTDSGGVARFAAPLLHGEGPLAPVAVQAFSTDKSDFSSIDLTAGAFDLSDRGVSGEKNPGPLDAFIWTDRGIYRPGETVQLMALLRDNAGNPADFPAQITIKRPNGQAYLQTTPARLADAALYLPIHLAPTSPAGTWTVEIRSDPKGEKPLATKDFRVDAFVPDRMAVDLGPLHGPIIPRTPYDLKVAARFLYGAPAANLSGTASMRLVIDDAPFPALAGWHIGLTDETYAPDTSDLPLPDTAPDGTTTLRINLSQAPDTTHPLKAAIDVVVNDPSGHGSRATTEIPLRLAGHLIAIRPAFAGDAIDAGTDAAFDIHAVDADGKSIPLKARLRLVRERPDWRLVTTGQLARYQTVWHDEPLETTDLDLPAHISKKLDFGRYRLEVQEAGGLAATSIRFRSGWATSDNPDVPDKVEISSDHSTYAPGSTARLHIAPPFAGEATLVIAGDRVFSLRNISVPVTGADLDIPIDPAWGPGAYAMVHIFHPGGRAIGVGWLGIDPTSRQLDIAIPAENLYRPRTRAEIPIRTSPGAWVSLAAVDEGILRLTNFVSPDPRPHFLGRRLLGLDVRDDWGRLIFPADGGATSLRQGGDEASFVLPEVPQKTVTLFTPPIQAGPDGLIKIPLDIPDFDGQIRLMAVAWSANRIGAASQDITVRDPLVAEALLPRFLAPGDQARLAILLHNVELSAGLVSLALTTEGPIQVADPHLASTLALSAQTLATTTLTATGVGRGVLHLDVTGPQNFHVVRDTAILIRPSRGPVSYASSSDLAPGAQTTLSPQADRFIPGTWHATASFGGAVHYDPAALVRSLAAYPLDCLEQATSRGLPLSMLPDGPLAGDDRAGRLQNAVQSVLDRQRFDGGFGLWSSSGEAEPWLSAYATDFLLRAQSAGAAVPDIALHDAEKFLADAADQFEGEEIPDNAAGIAAETYRLYLLARTAQGRPGYARVLAAQSNRLPTPLARAQLGAALALSHDTPRATAAFAAAFESPNRNWWYADYGTALRDQAAAIVLVKESGLLSDRLSRLVAALPGANLVPASLDTQEQAWAVAAAAVLTGRPARVALDGTTQPISPLLTVALTQPLQARNLDDQPVWQSVSAAGVPLVAPDAARSQMRITRQFFALDGTPLDLDHLTQNTMFVLLLEGRADDGQTHQAMLLHGLPAGWEIASRFAAGKPPGMDWLGELSDTSAQPAADDRFAAVLDLTPQQPTFRVAVRLRAVTPGTYELPGAELSDMYRPAIFARQATGRITVLPQ